MIKIIFYFVYAFYFFICVKNFIKKDYLNISTFIFIGVSVPVGLYLLNWSDIIIEKPSDEFYIIFIYFFSLASFFDIVYLKKQKKIDFTKFELKNKSLIYYITYMYCFLYLIESYLGAGTIFPSIHGIDIHAYSAPVISLITRSLYPFLVVNIFTFLKTKKIGYIINVIVLIFLTVVTRSSRMVAFSAILQCIFFSICYVIYTRKGKIKVEKKKIIKLIAVMLVVIISLGLMTNHRMSQNGKYNLKYSEEIKYTGPKVFKEVIAVYYGYFSLSFNNLNVNINHADITHNYIGLYTFVDLFFGVLQLDNILGFNVYQPAVTAIKVTDAATVRTAFYDYYYDFGYLCFIPMIVMFVIVYFIERNRNKNILWCLLYFYFIPNILLLGFQNVFFIVNNYWTILLLYIFSLLFFEENKTKKIERRKI